MSTTATLVETGPIKNHGWRVTFAGMGINLALGTIYTWSVISKNVPADWNWSESDKSLPYSIACLLFALTMIPAGRIQDKIGPRVVAMIGGLLVGTGMIAASFTKSPLGYAIGFGILVGVGIGFGYGATLPPAIKWFPKTRTGLISGIVLSGFGLASVYAAPTVKWLVQARGLPFMMLAFGIGFFVVVTGLAQLLKVPPAGYVPAGQPVSPTISTKKEEFSPREMLRTWQFYVLWLIFACGTGAGLMIIGKMTPIASDQAGLKLGFLLVAVLAVGNGVGRPLAGMISDKIGRKVSILLHLVLQAVSILLLSQARPGSVLATAPALTILAAVIGANFGAILALFPAATKDFYGLKNLGTNYGFVFTAYGVGGFMLPLFAGMVYDGKVIAAWKGSFNFAYFAAAGLLIASAIVVLFLKAPHHHLNPTADRR